VGGSRAVCGTCGESLISKDWDDFTEQTWDKEMDGIARQPHSPRYSNPLVIDRRVGL
jgi:hypothetical protein